MTTIWSVSELNRYARQKLESDDHLQGVRVRGEVATFKAYPSGHWYFTLKDDHAQLNCVLWRSRAERQRFRPREGQAVEALGNVTLYEVRGQFQLDVLTLQPAGEGELYRQFLALKARLEAEGLFAPERKRPLPRWPQRIGVVTSPEAAALRDILNILRRRFPLAEVLLSPTAVQGDIAPAQIVAALKAVAAMKPDVIIVARGGGAGEDLQAFNEEQVARAIAASPTPVVCGVGHETDFTIADFAADVRAPTPSAAAELVTPDRQQLLREVAALTTRLQVALRDVVQTRRWALAECQARLLGHSPQAQLRHCRQRLDDWGERIAAALTHRLTLENERLQSLNQRLHSVNPLAVLQRGYALVSRTTGAVIHRASEVTAGEVVHVQVSEGEFRARVL